MKTILKILSYPFILLIKIYQHLISPLLGPKCRFTPTCSAYALTAFKKYGVIKGFWLSVKKNKPLPPLGRQRLRSGTIVHFLKMMFTSLKV